LAEEPDEPDPNDPIHLLDLDLVDNLEKSKAVEISNVLSDYKPFIMTLVKKKSGLFIKYASKRLKNDREVVMAAIKNDLSSLKYIEPSMQVSIDEDVATLKTLKEIVKLFKENADAKLERSSKTPAEVIKKAKGARIKQPKTSPSLGLKQPKTPGLITPRLETINTPAPV